MNADPQQDADEVPAAYLSRYRKWAIGIAAGLGILALLVSRLSPAMYESRAAVLVRPLPTVDENVSPEDRFAGFEDSLATEGNVARSIEVAEIAVEMSGLDAEPQQMLGGLRVDVLPETAVLVFISEHSDRLVASVRAQAMAEAYLEFRRRVAIASVLDEGRELQAKLASVEGDLQDVLSQLRSTTEDAPRRSLEVRAGFLEGLATEIEYEITQLAELPSVGEIVSSANPARLPTDPHLVTGLAGLILGLGIGVAYAAIRGRRESVTADQVDFEAGLGAPVLAAIPHMLGRRRRRGPPVLFDNPKMERRVAEPYRILRTALLVLVNRGSRTFLITSAAGREGKTTTTFNLGIITARAGHKVVVVSTDVHDRTSSAPFGNSGDVGLTDVLLGRASADSVLLDTEIPTLRYLPPGTGSGDNAHLFASSRMKDLLKEFDSRFDIVLIDSGPLLNAAATIALAPLVDGVLIVVKQTEASPEQLRKVHAQAELSGFRIVGVVANDVSAAPSHDDRVRRRWRLRRPSRTRVAVPR